MQCTSRFSVTGCVKTRLLGKHARLAFRSASLGRFHALLSCCSGSFAGQNAPAPNAMRIVQIDPAKKQSLLHRR
jgi:hypothetical protein